MLTTLAIFNLIVLRLISAAQVQVFDFKGCRSLSNLMKNPAHQATDQCMLTNVEIMPNVARQILETESAQKCFEECVKYDKCDYFTFVEPMVTTAAIDRKLCYLKASPDYSSTTKLTVRLYTSPKTYKFTSGLKNGCRQTCTEEHEVFAGCALSSPSSCAVYGQAFDGSLGRQTIRNKESFALHRCCDTSSAGMPSYLQMRALASPKILATFLKGIQSAEECHTQCILSKTCTAWNFIMSDLTRYVGGACYLMNPASLGELDYVKVSAVGVQTKSGVNCTAFGSCTFSPYTPYQEVFLAEPLANSCQYQNIELDHLFTTVMDDVTEESCPRKCQLASTGCNYYMWKGNKCYLAYSNAFYTKNTDPTYTTIVGPPSCDETTLSGCLLVDKAYSGVPLLEHYNVVDAKTCLSLCFADTRCRFWSYSFKKCVFYAATFGTFPAAMMVSAPRTCEAALF